MLYQDQCDENLVMLTLAGEQTAYEVLVVRYERVVSATAKAVTGNHALAEDAAQDAFVTAWMKLNELREPQKYGSWVCRIAKNCALNMVSRYRSYLSLEDFENHRFDNEHLLNPARLYLDAEEKELVHRGISQLPEKVKEIIKLYYFEGLSIVEIAEKMQITQGTVKSQLHDGRKKLRRELCAMNEEMNDTLVTRVLKKVEELKNWQFQNSKNGFEIVYKDVLRDVEELPESEKKYHALADVLMRGWWWLPGEKNDALFDRIAEAAERGKNDEVMRFIAMRQDDKVFNAPKIDFIRNRQIPRLEKGGFVKALGSEWFWLGCAYFIGYSEGGDKNAADSVKGFEAFEKALEILPKDDIYYSRTQAVMKLKQEYLTNYVKQEKREPSYHLMTSVEEYRIQEGELCRYSWDRNGDGRLFSADLDIDFVLRNASFCDGRLTPKGLEMGDTFTGSDGTTLTFLEDGAKVSAPAGDFANCQVWQVKYRGSTYVTWFQEGVGIVKQERRCDGIVESRLLKVYKIKGGEGLVPVAVGNTWEYTAGYNPEVMIQASKIRVSYADEKKVMFSQNVTLERKKYDENSWLDMIQQIRNEYWDGSKCCDITYACERAQLLAKTPMEKAHTKAAVSVAKRILETNPGFNPDYTASGHWNFFVKNAVERRVDKVLLDHNFRWSFELKNTNGSPAQEALLYNDVYGILQEGARALWAEKWEPGTKWTEEFILWNRYHINAEIICETEGNVTTPAGSFENCLKLSLHIKGFEAGLEYMGGRKEYYFAEEIGIVKALHYYCHDTMQAIYELSAYEGRGQGYMPFEDGMLRRYDGVNLTDGHVGWVEYTYVADEDGELAIFSDRCGIRRKPEIITDYATIYGEILEDDLWEQGDRAESRLRHDINNFHILTHYLSRWPLYGKAERSLVWNQYRLRMMEDLDCGEGVPEAWLGLYARICLSTAAALCGSGRKEEGFEHLERAFTFLEKWSKIPDGTALEVGDSWIFGGIKLIKGMDVIELPDGRREPLQTMGLFHIGISMPYYALTSPKGWEWFNDVREDERFKEAVERARVLCCGK